MISWYSGMLWLSAKTAKLGIQGRATTEAHKECPLRFLHKPHVITT